MRVSPARAGVALTLFLGATVIGNAFVLTSPKITVAAQQKPWYHQRQHEEPSTTDVSSTCFRPLLLRPERRGAMRMTAADASTKQQQEEHLSSTANPVNIEDANTSEKQDVDAGKARVPRDETRRGVTSDGKALAFTPPTTQDLHKLQMGHLVARKGLVLTLVAASDEGQEVAGGPLAGAVIETMEGVGGSSVATKVCLMRHRRVDGVSESVEHALLDETITRFLNDGSRISQLNVEVEDSPAAIEFYSGHGFVHSSTSSMPLQEGRLLLSGERDAALQAIEGSLAKGLGVSAVMMNLLGRLRHDAGNLQGAVDAYLKALEMDPSRSEVFRGLGGAYQSQGQHQMAFASYQQAINVAPTDLLAYLKLGMLYEELAVGKYEEAGDHAIRCFEYYLQHSGSDDTDVLTRLGNLQVMRLDPLGGVETYEKTLALDPSLSNVWFNLANAHLKLGQESEAAECFREKLRLDPDSGVSTKYLLASLESDPGRLTKDDQLTYARELFDFYAPTYDDHMRKKLLYTGPRLLRQNMKEVYNATFQSLPQGTKSDYDGDVLSYLNASLDILDLGCGTGLIGSWFKDYAKKLVGVDVSPTMLDMATKKGCYHELRRGDVGAYLIASDEGQFDLVVAAETLQYIGPLGDIFTGTLKVLKPGGYFAFTVDRRKYADTEEEEKEVESERESRPKDQDHGDPGGYILKPDGTYAYDRAYLEELARVNGFEIVILKRHSTMIQRGDAAPGYMGVFKKAM